ncbi:hypothetical protein LJC74_10340 [Eubacteriales bacterium OttesenSCG-928-A19]|nr:hypothetical protein [Eubacteriales bacterium OttesenSCG-928-A19]
MTSKQIEIQTELSYQSFVAYINQFDLELDPNCIEDFRKAIEAEVVKEMIARGEESGHFLSITQYPAGN